MRMTTWWQRWRQRARALKREVHALALALLDPRTPWWGKALAALVVAYAFSPIDLTPDFVPVLGYLDDLVLLPLGIALTLRAISPQVMAEARARAAEPLAASPLGWLGAALVIALWLALLGLGLWAAWRLLVSGAMLGRALLSVLPGITGKRRFYHWLLRDAVERGPAGRAQVDEFVADWALAERCFKGLLLATAAVLDDATLRAWRTPTLYLVGENEKVYSAPRAIERLNRLAPQIETRLIARAGHDLWLTQPEAVNRALLDFLND